MLERHRVLGELITFNNIKGLRLDGILYQNEENDTTIIHVHGSFGNFYANRWLRIMAKQYLTAGINFLSFNLSAHDGIAEGYRYQRESKKDIFEYIGFSVVEFSTCLDDISGAIDFASQFSKKIILQGHSLGCDRVLYYLVNSRSTLSFILLSPADSYNLQKNWISPQNIDQQISRLKACIFSQGEYEWLSIKEYGIRQPPDEVYYIPITRSTLLSILEGPPMELLRIDSPVDFTLNQQVLVYLGGRDGFGTYSAETMFRYLDKQLPNVTRVYFPEGDHELKGIEVEVTTKIIEWVKSLM